MMLFFHLRKAAELSPNEKVCECDDKVDIGTVLLCARLLNLNWRKL